MKALGGLVLVSLAAMGVIAAMVFAGHDTTLFVPPPENVAEEFTRKLATGRYDVALAHLERNGPPALAPTRESGEALRARAGAINQIEGESAVIAGEAATATVRIDTDDAGEIRWTFHLSRRNGEWKIRDWR
jgi:hypothetical protein